MLLKSGFFDGFFHFVASQISGEDFSFLVDKYDERNLIKSEGCLHLVGFVSFRESFLVPKGEPWQLVLFHHAPPILFPVVQGNGKKHEVFAFQFVINGSQVFGFKAASSGIALKWMVKINCAMPQNGKGCREGKMLIRRGGENFFARRRAFFESSL